MTEQNYDYGEEVVYDGLAVLLAGIVDYLAENGKEAVPTEHFSKDYSRKNVRVDYDAETESLVFKIEDLPEIVEDEDE